MNDGFGKDFYKKGHSVKRFGRFSEPPELKFEKLLSSSPSQKSALTRFARISKFFRVENLRCKLKESFCERGRT